MKTHLHLSNWPAELTPAVQAGFDHVVGAAQALPFFYWPEKSAHAQDESRRNVRKIRNQCGLQSVWNVWLDQELRSKGFRNEVPVRPDDIEDAQRLDHALDVGDGQFICIENEFGNSSHIEANLLKFLDAYNWDRAALCVMICATTKTAAITTGGCVTYESTLTRLRRLTQRTLNFPLAIIGVDHEEAEQVDLSQSLIPNADMLSGNSDKRVLWHVVSEYRAGVCVPTIGLPGHEALRLANDGQRRRAVPSAQTALF